MISVDSIHIYPSNMEWETRINKITRTMIKMKIQKRVLVIGISKKNNHFIYKREKGVLVWLNKSTNLFYFNFFCKITDFLILYISCLLRLRNVKFNFLNPHSLSVLPLALILKFTKKNVKIIYDTHELETETSGSSIIKKYFKKIIEKICIKFVDQTIVVSPSIKKWYKKRYGLKKITTIINVPEKLNHKYNKSFNIQNFNLDPLRLTFCYHGILDHDRNVLELANFFKKNPNLGQIIFIGHGQFSDRIRKLSQKKKNIFFHKSTDHKTLYKIISIVDISFSFFSNKSLSQVYSLPNKMFESFYAGTPVIVNSNSDASRFVNKFNLGWEISNIEDLKNTLCKISKKEITVKSKNALKISNIYNWENEQKKIKRIYFNLN